MSQVLVWLHLLHLLVPEPWEVSICPCATSGKTLFCRTAGQGPAGHHRGDAGAFGALWRQNQLSAWTLSLPRSSPSIALPDFLFFFFPCCRSIEGKKNHTHEKKKFWTQNWRLQKREKQKRKIPWIQLLEIDFFVLFCFVWSDLWLSTWSNKKDSKISSLKTTCSSWFPEAGASREWILTWTEPSGAGTCSPHLILELKLLLSVTFGFNFPPLSSPKFKVITRKDNWSWDCLGKQNLVATRSPKLLFWKNEKWF